MKKVLILIILSLVNLAYSQVLPSGFKLGKIALEPNAVNQKDNIISPKSFKFDLTNPTPSTSIISNFISDIIVYGDTIWFGTGKGISRTTNNGITFQNFYGLPPFNEDDVAGIAIYNNIVVVSTATSQDIGNEKDVPIGTGIKVSTDYGKNWKSYPQPVESFPDGYDTIYYGNNAITALKVTTGAKNLSYDILVTRKNLTSDSVVIWITSWAGEIRKSIDLGEHFTRVILPPDNLDSIYWGGNYTGPNAFTYDPRDNVGNDNHKGFSLSAENDSTIYVGTAGGINKSTDWGISWRKYNYSNTGSGVSGNFVVALNVQRYGNKSIVWAATNIGGGGGNQFTGFSYTTNSGINWANTLAEDGIFNHNMGFKDSLVYCATDNGIWRSYFTPPNFSWSKPSVIYDPDIRDEIHTNLFYAVDSKGDSIWVGSGDGLARTRERGSAWTERWKIFRAYQPLTTTQETYAAPNPFSPKDEIVRIFFKTGKTSANVTVRIFDFGMNPVRTVLQNASRTNPDVIWAQWDGRRDDGSLSANGVYFYRIEVDNDMTMWGKILLLQ
jgi:hypothetical protein